MKNKFSTKWWMAAVGLVLLATLSYGLVYAQAGNGSITVNACYDQNADGDCEDPEDGAAPAEVEACLDDDTNCQAVPATFTDLAGGSYTPFLRFSGASQGHYPTTPRTPIDLAEGEQAEVSLGAVYPMHPKGVAVHAGLNKVYVAFQGPVVFAEAVTATATDTVVTKSYPFVAVIDGETDQVLQTIPGGENGIGREPWGVAVSGDNVYVGSFGEGRVSVIDANADTVVANVKPERDDFQPTAPAVNPVTGWVHFPDYRGGRVVMIDGTDIVDEPLIANQFGFSPFEMAIANTLQGYNFVTMRDAIVEDFNSPNPFQFRSFNSTDFLGFDAHGIVFEAPDLGRTSGSPHALGLWQEEGMAKPRLFMTYANDTRGEPVQPDFINPDKMLVYSFAVADPKNVLLRNANIEVGDYAEVGLVYNPATHHMLGTYAGFAYTDTNGDEAACNSSAHGGTYAVNFDGGILAGDAPGVWKLPNIVVGNPPLTSDNLQWKNPFEIAINPNNGKVYVTDRCWNEFSEGGKAGGGAVLIFIDTDTGPEPTPEPPGLITLVFEGPDAVASGETFSVDVVAQEVPDPGLYGVQLEVNYDPALISASNLQVNPDLSFVVLSDADNTTGKITLVASRQGEVPGLTGEVTLLTFEATAAETSDTATFEFENVKIGDSGANAFDIVTQSYTVTIGAGPTPEPTEEPTPEPTEEPTPEPTEEPTPEPTEEPPPDPTEEPTPAPAEEPRPEPTEEPTPEPTVAVVLGQVILAGRAGNDWSGATVSVDDSSQNATTDASGAFSIADVATGGHTSITADTSGYLSAVCTAPTVTASETTLAAVTLVSGDITDDEMVDITDATAVGVSFGETGPVLAADITGDGLVDIFDVILVSVNFGKTGPQEWVCQ